MSKIVRVTRLRYLVAAAVLPLSLAACTDRSNQVQDLAALVDAPSKPLSNLTAEVVL